MSKRIGQCGYCGKDARITKDHIPPRNIFPKPRPNNLITVPCCEACRVGWSKDDEYFRLSVLASHRVQHHPLAQKAFESIRSSLRRPSAWKFAQQVHDSLDEVELHSPAGLYLGRQGVMALSRPRVERVCERITRGLFFLEMGVPVPDSYSVYGTPKEYGFRKLISVVPKGNFEPWKVVGNECFRYTYAKTQEDPNCSMWLGVFYGGLFMFGFVTNE